MKGGVAVHKRVHGHYRTRRGLGISPIALRFLGEWSRPHTDEACESLVEAIALILVDRREDGLRGVPPEAIRETVIVG